MTSQGICVRTDGEDMDIKIFRTSACGDGCGNCIGCGGKERIIHMKNTLNLKVGEKVTLVTSTKGTLILAFLLYILPLLLFLTAHQVLLAIYGDGLEEIYSIGAFVTILALTCILHRKLSRLTYFGTRMERL